MHEQVKLNFMMPAFISENRSALFFAIVFFNVFPFLYSAATIDPELHLRYFAASGVLFLANVIFLWRTEKSEIKKIFIPDQSVLCFSGFLIVSAISVISSINPGDGWYEVSKIFILWIFFNYVVYSYKRDEKAMEIYTACIVVAAIVFSIFGFIAVLPAIAEAIARHHPFSLKHQLTSVFGNKNFYAEAIFLCLPFSLYGSFFLKNRWRTGSIISLVLIIISIVVLVSLAVWIALFVFISLIFLLIFFLRKKISFEPVSRKQKNIAYAALIFGIVILVIPVFFKPVQKIVHIPIKQKMDAIGYYLNNDKAIFSNSQSNANSLFERMLMLRNSIKMFKENPVTGNGMANWKILFPKYGVSGTGFLSLGVVRFEHPHNDYVLILCEQGIIGLLFWMGIFFFAFKNGIRFIDQNENDRKSWFMLFMLSGIGGFMTISLFSYPKERLYSMLFLLTMLAYPAALYPVKLKLKLPNGRLFLVVLSILCLASVTIMWKRYSGELFMKRAKMAQSKNNLPEMYIDVMKAKSWFFPIDITSTPLNWYLGLTSYHIGEVEKAFNYYTLALKQNPYHLQILNDLATLYEKKGMTNEAIGLYKRALAVSPANGKALLNLTIAYYNSGNPDEAFIHINHYPDTNDITYRKTLKIMLVASANNYVQLTKDSLLADFLSVKLGADENYLLNLYRESPGNKIPFERLAVELKRTKYN